MAQPTICINGSGEQIPVYDDENSTNRVGTLYPKELFTRVGFREIFFLSPEGRRYGYIHPIAGSLVLAYEKGFSYEYVSGQVVEGYTFRLRRRCRVFTGNDVWEYLYPGDEIIAHPDNSYGGYEHPYRLKIEGWRTEGGSLHTIADAWCDTDYEIGYSMHHEATTYGQWG